MAARLTDDGQCASIRAAVRDVRVQPLQHRRVGERDELGGLGEAGPLEVVERRLVPARVTHMPVMAYPARIEGPRNKCLTTVLLVW